MEKAGKPRRQKVPLNCFLLPVSLHNLPTVFFFEAPELIANRIITWTDWSARGSHPATIGSGNIIIQLF